MNNQRNLQIYRLWSPIYDALFGTIFKRPRKQAIDLLQLQAGERLLLSGAGTGLDLPLVVADVRITAVDLSQPMLQKASEKDNGRSTFALMDAQTLALPAATFDAVALNLILSVVPDGAAAFSEAWRVLRPGGRIVIFDKFLQVNGRLSLPRRMMGKLIAGLGTDPNRRLNDILSQPYMSYIQQNEASMMRGQYRIVLLQKPMTSIGVDKFMNQF